jgi:hypothetical protein
MLIDVCVCADIPMIQYVLHYDIARSPQVYFTPISCSMSSPNDMIYVSRRISIDPEEQVYYTQSLPHSY